MREVPRWKAENDCYSCHNNGDAARALIAAAARGFTVGTAMDDTLEWLRRPGGWNKNKTTGGIDDKPLARIQFASALRLAVDNTRAPRDLLGEAAHDRRRGSAERWIVAARFVAESRIAGHVRDDARDSGRTPDARGLVARRFEAGTREGGCLGAGCARGDRDRCRRGAPCARASRPMRRP